MLAAATVSPIELLRTKMQYHGRNGSIKQVSRTLRHAITENGVQILWKGLVPTLWRDVPFSGIYWMTIERIRPVFRNYFYPVREGDVKAKKSAASEFGLSFASGALSGMVAAAATTPFDVAKTRRQIAIAAASSDSSSHSALGRYSLSEQLRSIWREEGLAGLFRGIVPRVGKVAPACAIMLGSYEVGKIYFSRIV